jgi:ubiquinone/menaquinone biosynthesis C-methylase UbiE
METRQIAEKYDGFARFYDVSQVFFEVLGVRRLRRELVRNAVGDVLEVAVGTGMNLPYYPASCRLTAIDASRGMLSKAEERAAHVGREARFEVMDAEQLAFSDESFDTVIDTLSLCTFADPVATLRQLGRVCRRSGRILLLEHGRSDAGWFGAFQDHRARKHAQNLGCIWNREPLALVEKSGLRVIHAERHFFGVFHVIHAAPN